MCIIFCTEFLRFCLCILYYADIYLTIFTKLIHVLLDNIGEFKNYNMTFNTLQSLLPNDEIHYTTDCDVFFSENNINPDKFKDNTFILFEYTIANWYETIKLLNTHNIKYTIHTDELNLDYIVI